MHEPEHPCPALRRTPASKSELDSVTKERRRRRLARIGYSTQSAYVPFSVLAFGSEGTEAAALTAMGRQCAGVQVLAALALLVSVRGAPYEPTEAEKLVGAKIHHAANMADKIAYYDEFVELKNARIAEAAEGQRVARAIADDATKRADMLADRLAVEAAAVGVERSDASRKHALVVAAEKNVALLRSQLDDARSRLKYFEEKEPKPGQLADMISSNVGYVGAAAGDARGGRQFGFALAGALEKAHRELRMLESAVEARTGVLTYHGRILAAFVCSLGFCLPLWFTSCLLGRITRSIGYKQHLIVGYIFNATVAAGSLFSYFLIGQDPLVTIASHSAARFCLCLFFILQWAVMVLLILHGGLVGYRKPAVLFEAVLQLVLYTSMILHMRLLTYTNLIKLAEKVEGAHVIWRYYIGYILVFAALTFMTAARSAGKSDGGLVRDVNEAISSGVTGVVDEAEKLLGSSSGGQSSEKNSRFSRSGMGSQGSRSSGDSLNGISVHIDEVSAAKVS